MAVRGAPVQDMSGKKRMNEMPRTFAVTIALVAMLMGGAARATQDVTIAAFAGHWVGSGIARSDLSEYFKMTLRDLDVIVTLKGDGFVIAWTTVLREGGTSDNPKVRRKSTTLDFVPAGRPGVFRDARGGVDPLSGAPYAWARIRGQTLTVHSLVIDDDGSYEMHSYDRTLVGAGMELEFTRVRDGEPTKTVTGKLVKAAQ